MEEEEEEEEEGDRYVGCTLAPLGQNVLISEVS